MSVTSRLKATKINGHRKAFYRQRIPESSCVRKENVDIDILVTSRNGEKFSQNNFPFSYVGDNTSSMLNRGGIADLPLLRTLAKSLTSWEVIDCFVLLAYESLAASRTFLESLLACLNVTLESEDLSFCYKQKKWFLWTMAAVQAAEKHGDVSDLTWYFLSEIYRSTGTHSQNSLAANMKTWQTWHGRLWLMFNIHIKLFLALEKGENCQSHFSSGSHHLVKKSPLAKFLITLHWGHPPPCSSHNHPLLLFGKPWSAMTRVIQFLFKNLICIGSRLRS